ncbi:MAG TPA: MBL fold metallo-hydrolase, partial [Acidimicrobiia bacterium]|nr:MBL fold metallo-hydrolase [Acidimicrobiia bacterium]
MIFTQYYLGCLSHASYLVGDEQSGRAVVFDPQRDVSGYLREAEQRGLHIERVIETHFHADFLSGHLELAARTGASIAYGAAASDVEFDIERLVDGQRFELGDVQLQILETPGHTPESISIVVYEHRDDDVPYGVLTGDTLFIGDVGRPDLMAAIGVAPDDLARQLYRSLHTKLLVLPDATRVFPAHGAGSACGKNLSTEIESTIGDQKRSNYALAPMTEDEFVAIVTEGQPTTPLYFSFDARMNRSSRPLLAEDEPPPALTLDDVLAHQLAGGVVLDTREPFDFAAGHLPRAINVGLQGRFAEYCGDVLSPADAIALVGDPGTERETKVRLARIGFDRVVGYLDDAIAAFLERPDLLERSSRLTAPELVARQATLEHLTIVDVRNPTETAAGAIPGSVAMPLPRLTSRVDELDPTQPTVVYCASGYRSATAASLLASRAFADEAVSFGG